MSASNGDPISRYHAAVSHELFELIERMSLALSSEVRACAVAHELKEVQLEVLLYLHTCNRYSNTPAAVGEYLGRTKGTVSQTLDALAKKQLLHKVHDANDARVVHCVLTPAGERIAKSAAPTADFRTATERLGSERVERLTDDLRALLLAMQRARGGATFGACHSCIHFQHEGGQAFRCGLTREPLSREDSLKICREHTT